MPRKPENFTNKAFQRGEDSDEFFDDEDDTSSDDRFANTVNGSDSRDDFERFAARSGSYTKRKPQRLNPARISDDKAKMSSGRQSNVHPPGGELSRDSDRRERHHAHHRSQANTSDQRPRKKRPTGGGEDISSAVKTAAPEQIERIKTTGQAGGNSSASSTRQHAASPTPRSTLRSAVYYQNRFIILETPESRGASDGYAANSTNTSRRSGSRDNVSNSPHHRTDGLNKETSLNSGSSKHRHKMSSDIQRKPGNRRNMEMDASSVTMDARGIEIILTDPENSSRPIASESKGKNTIWQKIGRLLQDNRMKDNPDSDRILNADHPEDYRLLKKVLNILFLTIGVVLFLAVIVVVIYAFAVGDPPPTDEYVTTTSWTLPN